MTRAGNGSRARRIGLQPVHELLEEAVDLVAVIAAPAESEAGIAQAIEVLPVHGPDSVVRAA